MNRTELAWAAGLFCGEGWTTLKRQGKHHRQRNISMGIYMQDKEAVERFYNIVKCGYLYTHVRGENNYRDWQATSFQYTQHVICLLWEWLTECKRDQIRRCFKELEVWWKIRDNTRDRRGGKNVWRISKDTIDV